MAIAKHFVIHLFAMKFFSIIRSATVSQVFVMTVIVDVVDLSAFIYLFIDLFMTIYLFIGVTIPSAYMLRGP